MNKIEVLANGIPTTHTQFNNLSWTVGEGYRMRKRGCKRVRIFA